jgi:molecular chaperone Hsp33
MNNKTLPEDHLADLRRRFLLPTLESRLVYVQLEKVWQLVAERQDYPLVLQNLLAESLAAAALLAAILKVSGSSLTLQIRSSGQVHLLSVQARQEGLRGLLRWQGEVIEGDFSTWFGHDAVLAITLEQPDEPPYQSLVSLQGNSLKDVLEQYFVQSEQLPTRLFIARDDKQVVALLLQRLPTAKDGQLWEEAVFRAETLTDKELLENKPFNLLPQVFSTVEWLEDSPLTFACTCSLERAKAAVEGLGEEDLKRLLQEQEKIIVDCQFCGAVYYFSADDFS